MVSKSTIYTVGPMETVIYDPGMSVQVQTGLDRLIGETIAAEGSGITWEYGGGVGGYQGLKETMVKKLEALLPQDHDGDPCDATIDYFGSLGEAATTSIEISCPRQTFHNKSDAEKFEVSKQLQCYGCHRQVAEKLTQWLVALPQKLDEADAKIDAANEALRKAEQDRSGLLEIK